MAVFCLVILPLFLVLLAGGDDSPLGKRRGKSGRSPSFATRTYALSKMLRAEEGGNSADHPSAPQCDDTHCQVYRDEEELLELKGKDRMEDGWVNILEAVRAIAGEVMYYDGALVEQPLFHSASGGKTENSEDVFVSALPYLRSVDSLYEGEAPYQNETISISLTSLIEKVREAELKKSTLETKF